MRGDQVSDLSPLSGLTSLTGLGLWDNQISDLSALSGLTKLTHLNLWNNPLNLEAYCTYLPLIEDNNPGIYLAYAPNPNPPGACPDSDDDGVADDIDNCPGTSNQHQLDTYPPQGNGIGDACDCEADFNCNGRVDATDVMSFIRDFARNPFLNPCTNTDPCNGDFNCDGNVDTDDITMFLQDFGRGQYTNPCPACTVEDWCVYP